jgi:hypothetical protein
MIRPRLFALSAYDERVLRVRRHRSAVQHDRPQGNFKADRSGQVRASFAEFSAKLTLPFHGQWSKMARRVRRRDRETKEEELIGP